MDTEAVGTRLTAFGRLYSMVDVFTDDDGSFIGFNGVITQRAINEPIPVRSIVPRELFYSRRDLIEYFDLAE